MKYVCKYMRKLLQYCLIFTTDIFLFLFMSYKISVKVYYTLRKIQPINKRGIPQIELMELNV